MFKSIWHELSLPETDKAPKLSFYRDGSPSLHDATSLSMVNVPRPQPKILLVDDEASFGKIMQRSAEALGMNITYRQRLEELPDFKEHSFDVVILDYDLGAITGTELADYIEKLALKELPMILVSQTPRQLDDCGSGAIREFVHKDAGPAAILDAACEAYEVQRICNRIRDVQ